MIKNNKILFILSFNSLLFINIFCACFAENTINVTKQNPVHLVFSKNNILQKTSKKNETVILFHGLGRSYHSMQKLGNYLSEHNFNIIYVDYPSRKFSIEKLTTFIYDSLKQNHVVLNKNINIVTHSLGGIIARNLIKKYHLTINRVVMIAPPNQGSEIIDHLKGIKLFKSIMGPAAEELGTDPKSVPNILGAVNFDLGIIAGNVSLNPLFSYWIKRESDGKVSVKRAMIKGMKDFRIMPYSHTFIMQRKKVFEQISHFLKYGYFANKM